MEEVSLVVGSSFNCVKCDQPAQYSGNDLKRTKRKSVPGRGFTKSSDCVRWNVLCVIFLLNQVGEALRQVHFKRLMIEPTILVLVSVSSSEEINKVIEKVDKLKLLLPENINWAIAHVASYLLDDFRPSLSDFSGKLLWN
ncbi:unnamed protein product [Caenorhabditis auriculariae]|uniref:Uncharacterized protein n=1 Tax=Caenorhabditis auriculariae TaxID=2777116 RepID=A0A8S1GPT8_9PELO|nr:unnamed protein product [Caenorhabditis auriculariae]